MARGRLELGNLAQWVSAACAVIVATIALWAFFSPTSQALIAYLQSELTSRNLKIADLEQEQRDLVVSISQRQDELQALGGKVGALNLQIDRLGTERAGLEQQNDKLREDQKTLSDQLSTAEAALEKIRFIAVREKIHGQIAGVIVVTLPLNLSSELFSARGIKERDVNFWTDYLAFVQSTVDKLPVEERPIGNEIVRRFVEHCQSSSITLHLPALKQPSFTNEAEYKRVSDKVEALSDKMISMEQDIKSCFEEVSLD